MRKGFALVSVLIMLAVLMSLLTAYFTLTQIELGATQASVRQTTGFYAAEAGLNLRAEEVRAKFLGYGRPSGTSPSSNNPCQGSNLGSGDFACKTYSISGRTVRTYMVEPPGNPETVQIPPGELFENLEAQEYRYSLFSEAIGPDGRTEAVLELVFKSRLVPMFQFAAFYDKDLEILPGPPMTLNGRVHTNGDLYLNAGNTLTIEGQVSTAGRLYRGRKEENHCSGTVKVKLPNAPNNDPNDPRSYRALDCAGGVRREYRQEDVAPWEGRIQVGVNRVTVPSPEELDPDPSRLYFSRAQLRLRLNLFNQSAEVVRPDGTVDPLASQTLNLCPGTITGRAVGNSNTFFDNREGKPIQMLEVDLRGLLDCVHLHNLLGAGVRLDDETNGGLVFHLTVHGPESGTRGNGYGVRIRNGARIASTIPGAPRPRGLTIVSDQPVYIQGDFNRDDPDVPDDWIPAAFLTDAINILSNAWNDDNRSRQPLTNRRASDTEVNAAFLGGTDTTGGQEGSGGQDRGQYNGGLENYPRFHEAWQWSSGNNREYATFTYRGSFVSLGNSRKAAGRWCYRNDNCNRYSTFYGTYEAPRRNWSYEVRFSQGQLPPLSPRFVYLRQERFLREFERP
ncbi:pilus assembly PilX family protein [Thermus sediminis]|nr:pilus assembly PilX N-terminal domain-containing protein [Thermus sediminis]